MGSGFLKVRVDMIDIPINILAASVDAIQFLLEILIDELITVK
jgi:hypothetical protein